MSSVTPKIHPKQSKQLNTLAGKLGLSRERKIAGLVALVKRPIESSNDLTEAEANLAIQSLRAKVDALIPEPPEPDFGDER